LQNILESRHPPSIHPGPPSCIASGRRTRKRMILSRSISETAGSNSRNNLSKRRNTLMLPSTSAKHERATTAADATPKPLMPLHYTCWHCFLRHSTFHPGSQINPSCLTFAFMFCCGAEFSSSHRSSLENQFCLQPQRTPWSDALRILAKL
jgi:hypothetical protein